jgi:hypothetical protein
MIPPSLNLLISIATPLRYANHDEHYVPSCPLLGAGAANSVEWAQPLLPRVDVEPRHLISTELQLGRAEVEHGTLPQSASAPMCIQSGVDKQQCRPNADRSRRMKSGIGILPLTQAHFHGRCVSVGICGILRFSLRDVSLAGIPSVVPAHGVRTRPHDGGRGTWQVYRAVPLVIKAESSLKAAPDHRMGTLYEEELWKH